MKSTHANLAWMTATRMPSAASVVQHNSLAHAMWGIEVTALMPAKTQMNVSKRCGHGA